MTPPLPATFLTLPPELHHQIGTYLSQHQLLRILAVSRTLNSLYSPPLHRRLAARFRCGFATKGSVLWRIIAIDSASTLAGILASGLVDVDASVGRFPTLLTMAVAMGRPGVARVLLDAGARTIFDKETVLHAGVAQREWRDWGEEGEEGVQVVAEAIRRDVDRLDSMGWTVLEMAVKSGDEGLAKILMGVGADPRLVRWKVIGVKREKWAGVCREAYRGAEGERLGALWWMGKERVYVHVVPAPFPLVAPERTFNKYWAWYPREEERDEF